MGSNRKDWVGSIIKVGGAPAPPNPPFAPAYRPVIGSIIKGEKIIKVGGGSRPPPTPPFCTGLSAGDRINH